MLRISRSDTTRMPWGTPGGNQTARCGGTTSASLGVSTHITPDIAYNTCPQSCSCGSIYRPRGYVRDNGWTATAVSERSGGAARAMGGPVREWGREVYP